MALLKSETCLKSVCFNKQSEFFFKIQTQPRCDHSRILSQVSNRDAGRMPRLKGKGWDEKLQLQGAIRSGGESNFGLYSIESKVLVEIQPLPKISPCPLSLSLSLIVEYFLLT